MTKEYLIKGMNCTHCQAAAQKAIESVEGVSAATVDLKSGKAFVEGEHQNEAVIEAVRRAGFDAQAL